MAKDQRDENDAQDMLSKGPKDSVYHKSPSVVGTNTSGIDFQVDYGFDWEQLGMENLGSMRFNALLTHVAEKGWLDRGFLTDVWEWDGGAWRDVTPG